MEVIFRDLLRFNTLFSKLGLYVFAIVLPISLLGYSIVTLFLVGVCLSYCIYLCTSLYSFNIGFKVATLIYLDDIKYNPKQLPMRNWINGMLIASFVFLIICLVQFLMLYIVFGLKIAVIGGMRFFDGITHPQSLVFFLDSQFSGGALLALKIFGCGLSTLVILLVSAIASNVVICSALNQKEVHNSDSSDRGIFLEPLYCHQNGRKIILACFIASTLSSAFIGVFPALFKSIIAISYFISTLYFLAYTIFMIGRGKYAKEKRQEVGQSKEMEVI